MLGALFKAQRRLLSNEDQKFNGSTTLLGTCIEVSEMKGTLG